MVIACRRYQATVAAFRRRKKRLLPCLFGAVVTLGCLLALRGCDVKLAVSADMPVRTWGDDMKFVAAALIIAVASLTSAVAQNAAQTATTNVAAKAKRSYEQCYKDCTSVGGKPRSCGTQCANKS
jgi:F0F1-type ATP synthase membrane subunit c/vacuolar-type H+-ATPase subunit K